MTTLSVLQAQRDALAAKKGDDYFAEWDAWSQAMVDMCGDLLDQLSDVQLALVSAVTATSTTPLAMTTGAHTITVDTAKGFAMGMQLTVAHDVNNLMFVTAQSYDAVTGSLQFTVLAATDIRGGGTYTSWTISPSGEEGPAAIVDEGQIAMASTLFGL